MTDFETIDFFRDTAFIADPYPYFEFLREQCPDRRLTRRRRADEHHSPAGAGLGLACLTCLTCLTCCGWVAGVGGHEITRLFR